MKKVTIKKIDNGYVIAATGAKEEDWDSYFGPDGDALKRGMVNAFEFLTGTHPGQLGLFEKVITFTKETAEKLEGRLAKEMASVAESETSDEEAV